MVLPQEGELKATTDWHGRPYALTACKGELKATHAQQAVSRIMELSRFWNKIDGNPFHRKEVAMKKKIYVLIVAVLICALLSACEFTVGKVSTAKTVDKTVDETVNETTIEVYSKEITSPKELMKAENYDIAGASFRAVEEAEPEAVTKLLDKETILIVNNINDKELKLIADKLRLDYIETEKTPMQTTIGACLRKQEDGSYLLSEVAAEIAKPRAGKKVTEPNEEEVKKSLAWLEKNAKIDLIEQYHEIKGEDLRFSALAAAPPSDEATEQVLGKPFAAKSVYYYLYAASNPENGHPIYLSNQDSSKYHLATIHICMIGVKVKTDGNRTIDSFAADFTANAKNGLNVKEFQSKLETPEESRYNILWASQLDSDSVQAVTTSVSNDGDSVISYAYKTGEADVVNQIASTAYSNRWTAKPVSPSRNTAYTISPSMTVAVSNGKNTAAQAKAAFSYLNLHQSLTAGWVSDQDKTVTIKYKNHSPA